MLRSVENTDPQRIGFIKLHPDAVIPQRQTFHSAGFDLTAIETITIRGGHGNVPIRTGIAILLPPETYGRLAIRSGLALREHLAVEAGVIDIDYFPGEIIVMVSCTKTNHLYTIEKGTRFAQIIVEKISTCDGYEIQDNGVLSIASLHAGFGSTGNF